MGKDTSWPLMAGVLPMLDSGCLAQRQSQDAQEAKKRPVDLGRVGPDDRVRALRYHHQASISQQTGQAVPGGAGQRPAGSAEAGSAAPRQTGLISQGFSDTRRG